jgi:hypothetical protein
MHAVLDLRYSLRTHGAKTHMTRHQANQKTKILFFSKEYMYSISPHRSMDDFDKLRRIAVLSLRSGSDQLQPKNKKKIIHVSSIATLDVTFTFVHQMNLADESY